MKAYFQDVAGLVSKNLASSEKFTLWFSAEELDYARFNHAKIRQAGSVSQQFIEIDLIDGARHANIYLGLSGQLDNDSEPIKQALKLLRQQIKVSDDDPYLMINEANKSSCFEENKQLDKFAIVQNILANSQGLDLVGSYLGGPIYKGFANSSGQVNWFHKSSFIIDTSIYHSGDKAIKQSYCDTSFNQDIFKRKITETKAGLELFNKEAITIKPASYRVYFSPTAVNEIIAMLNWGGFSRKSLEVKNSPLMPLWTGDKSLSANFSLSENLKNGVGPHFQAQGFIKNDTIDIIKHGHLKNTLIAPKTAKEYKLDHNGADDNEQMTAIEMAPGHLSNADIMTCLNDGLYINNLWYLNFSDRYNGCLTGMTRFFCYVVKNGRPLAPFSVMRFDDSIYRIFGKNLAAITKERELIIDNDSYEERSTSCSLLPGIIVNDVKFTL